MKKIVSLLLILLIFINSGGFVIVFYQLKKAINGDILNMIKSNKHNVKDLLTVRVLRRSLYKNNESLIWKNKNEFQFNGKLYDIISIKYDKKNSKFCLIKALNDKKEEKLFKFLYSSIINSDNSKAKNSRFISSINNLITQGLPVNYKPINFILKVHYKVETERANILDNFLSPVAPPPKFV